MIVATVFSERDVVIIRYRFGSMQDALSWLSTYRPPEDSYVEIEEVGT